MWPEFSHMIRNVRDDAIFPRLGQIKPVPGEKQPQIIRSEWHRRRAGWSHVTGEVVLAYIWIVRVG